METHCGGPGQWSGELQQSWDQDFSHPWDEDKVLRRQGALTQEWRVRTVTMLLEFQNGLCSGDWPAGHQTSFFLFMTPMKLQFPASLVVRSASQCVLTYGCEQRGYMCLLVHSAFLSKSACFMHTNMMSWKIHTEDHTEDDRCKNRRNLGPHITTCTIGKNKSNSILNPFPLL